MRQLAILLLLACTACATRADGPSSTQAAPAAAVQAPAPGAGAAVSGTLARIYALVGKAECSSDNQCKILPVGARACGGPASYLAWSSANTDAAKLQALVERHKSEQQADNTATGRISTCIVLAQPAVACRAGTCQLTDALETR